MKPFSFEDLSGPAAAMQLHIFRALRLLALTGTGGDAHSYEEVKKLAIQLELNSLSRLKTIFHNLDLGELELSMGNNQIQVCLSRSPGSGPAEHRCELEKGLIDGALELIAGVPVTTANADCELRGDGCCKFEAIFNGDSYGSGFLPGKTSSVRPVVSTGASMDALPDLRSWYLDLAGRELARARRHQRALALLYIDIDDLGKINRRAGRRHGDAAINAAAASLGKNCRMEDIVWHNGEDEFVVLLSEAGPGGEAAVAERLTTLMFFDGSDAFSPQVKMSIGLSIGCAVFPGDGEDIPGLLTGAKKALYLAKADGKGKWREAGAGGKNQNGKEKSGGPREGEKAGLGIEAVDSAEDQVKSSSAAPAVTGNDEISRREDLLKGASVLIASISPLILTGMREIISSAQPVLKNGIIASEITDPASLPEAVPDLRPDLIFTDMQMATHDNFALLRLVRDDNLPCKIVVFAADIDSDVIKLASNYSLDGMIMQTTPVNETQSLLDKIYHGISYLPEQVSAALTEVESNRRQLGDLSERELEVLRLVSEGKSNSQISEQLFISINTVRFHLANIYQKLGVSNRTEAANYILRHNLRSVSS